MPHLRPSCPIWLVITLCIASICLLATESTNATELSKRSKAQAQVILVRGGFNIFSEGLDSISTKLASRGVKSTVYRHRQSAEIVQAILTSQRRYGRSPIILVGHSWGANAILKVAKTLQTHQLKVRYMVTFAATNPTRAATNIQELTNFYFKKDGWGKAIRSAPGFKGQLRNVDMSGNADVHHFNVDEHPRLQAQVVGKIVRLVRGRKYAENEQVPVYSAGEMAKPEG